MLLRADQRCEAERTVGHDERGRGEGLNIAKRGERGVKLGWRSEQRSERGRGREERAKRKSREGRILAARDTVEET
jgi:hypothetical protein